MVSCCIPSTGRAPISRSLRFLPAALAVALAAARASADPCPQSCVRVQGPYPSGIFEVCTSAAALDTCAHDCAGFDTRAGTFRALSGRGYAFTAPSDDFQVVGPPTSTPLAFQLAVHITGNLDPPCRSDPKAFARVTLLVREGTSNQLFWDSDTVPNCEDNHDFDRTFLLPIQRLVGQTFRVHIEAEAAPSIFAGATIEGSYDFVALPAGYSIVSCQGFAPNPIAVRESSWGRVKSMFR